MTLDYFRCRVAESPAISVGPSCATVHTLSKPEIYQLDVAFAVKHHILGLQVSVNNLRIMYDFECLNYLGGIEFNPRIFVPTSITIIHKYTSMFFSYFI